MSVTSSPHTPEADHAPGRATSPGVKHRPSWIVFVVLGAIVCLAMGFWQLARYQAASGTVQNLGYTFMWPFLAWFLVYAYYKYIRLEAEEAAENLADAAEGVGVDVGADGSVGEDPDDDDEVSIGPAASRSRTRSRTRTRERSSVATEIPADILPTRRPAPADPVQDEGLRTYNSYLAELARQDGALGDRSQERPQK